MILQPEPDVDAVMCRRGDMTVYYDCHPDCPHMYECIVYGMRCQPYEIPNFAIIEDAIRPILEEV